MQLRLPVTLMLAGSLFLAACAAPAAMPAQPDTAMTEKSPATAPEAMGDSMAMSETVAMSETMAMDSQKAMTDTHTMDDSMAMSETMAMDDSKAMSDTAMTQETTAASQEAMMKELPAWQTMALTDARTGETFTLADFKGKHVFVETMATWCPNCRQQLGNVKSAVAQADAEKMVFVAISVETDLPPSTLAQYASDNGFEWPFAVASAEMVQALAETFGTTVANPPATPHFVILPDGSHGELVTGFETGEQILAGLGM